MYKYWFLIRDTRGAPIKVYEFADNPFLAYEIAKAKYGNNLLTESANRAD